MKNNKLTTIYIARHAECENNIKDIIGADSLLTEKGRRQADALSQKLNLIHFDHIFSSNSIRTKETAHIIANKYMLQVLPDEVLNERNYGIYEGEPIEKFQKDMKDVHKKMQIMNNEEIRKFRRYETFETDEELINRFTGFLEKIIVKHDGEKVLIVTHGILMRVFLIHLGFATYKSLPPFAIDNIAYIRLESDGKNYIIKETSGIKKVS